MIFIYQYFIHTIQYNIVIMSNDDSEVFYYFIKMLTQIEFDGNKNVGTGPCFPLCRIPSYFINVMIRVILYFSGCLVPMSLVCLV